MPDVVRWFADNNVGILGIEVYGRLGEAHGSFQGDWRVQPGRRHGERWECYVERAAKAALQGIEAELAQSDATGRREDEAGDLRYFIAITIDDHYS